MESYFKAFVAFRLRLQDWKEHYMFLLDPRSHGIYFSRTFQGCWLVTTHVTPHRTRLYTLHPPITAKHFPCKQDPPSFPQTCGLRQVPERHRSFKCIFFKGMWIPSARVNFHNSALFQHHLKALRCPITTLKNQFYSSESKENLLKKNMLK